MQLAVSCYAPQPRTSNWVESSNPRLLGIAFSESDAIDANRWIVLPSLMAFIASLVSGSRTPA
jgi:hypothetical protein